MPYRAELAASRRRSKPSPMAKAGRRRKLPKDVKTTSIKLEVELIRFLKSVAGEQETSVSDLIRDLLSEWALAHPMREEIERKKKIDLAAVIERRRQPNGDQSGE